MERVPRCSLLSAAIAAYVLNRAQDVGILRSQSAALITLLLSAGALVAFALEGFICIFMAAPLGVPMALLGAYVGRHAALKRHGRHRQSASALALLPLVLIFDWVMPPEANFATEKQITVAAAP